MKNQRGGGESDAPGMSDSQCPIPGGESDTFGTRLRSLIEGESIAGFARRVGVPEANIHTYLRGMSPQMDKLVRIADACGVTVDWLATGRGIRRAVDMRKAEKALQDGAFRVIEGEARPLTPAEQDASTARRLEAIAHLVAGLDSPREQAALLDEFLSRAQNAAEMHALKQAVAELRAAQKSA